MAECLKVGEDESRVNTPGTISNKKLMQVSGRLARKREIEKYLVFD